MVKQISVFLENKSGRLAEATRAVGNAGVNIRALSVADTSDFGVLRFIADDAGKAVEALRAAGFTATATEVVAAEVPDRPGGLAELLDLFRDNSINVEYLYAFLNKTHENAIIIIKVGEKEKTLKLLESKDIRIIQEEEIGRL